MSSWRPGRHDVLIHSFRAQQVVRFYGVCYNVSKFVEVINGQEGSGKKSKDRRTGTARL